MTNVAQMHLWMLCVIGQHQEYGSVYSAMQHTVWNLTSWVTLLGQHPGFMLLRKLLFDEKYCVLRWIRMGITIFKIFVWGGILSYYKVRNLSCCDKFPTGYPTIYRPKCKFWIQLSPEYYPPETSSMPTLSSSIKLADPIRYGRARTTYGSCKHCDNSYHTS